MEELMPHNEQSISKKERREQKRQDRKEEQLRARHGGTVRRIIIWLVALIVLAGIGVWTYQAATTKNPSAENQNGGLSTEITEADWVRGNANSPITLVEYGDFQCPACAQYHSIVKALEAEFSENVRFVFRHFPLRRIHPNADEAARAAEAAGAQGKFWEMHDILFERQNEWSIKPRPKSTFVDYARELELDIDAFERDMDSDKAEKKVEAHFQSGVASNVSATPTFFLNGEKIQNPRSLNEFRALLASAIAELLPEETTSIESEESSHATSTENQ